MAKFKLVKMQIPVKKTYELLIQLSSLDNYEQIIVDPQSPTEQARVQALKDALEDSGSRLLEICSIFGTVLTDLPQIKSEDLSFVQNPNNVVKDLEEFLYQNEEKIKIKFNDLQRLKKEDRILSSLTLFQSEMETDELSIDLLSSGPETFTVLGEIPSGYEEIIRFYLNEVTAGKVFFWSSLTENTEKKVVIIISTDEHKDRIVEILNENHFDETKFDIDVLQSIKKTKEASKISDIYSGVTQDINLIEEELSKLSSDLNEVVRYKLTLMKFTHEVLIMEEKGRTTSKNFTIWGWIKSKEYNNYVDVIKSFDLDCKITVLEDVPLSYKKERDLEQILLVPKPFSLIDKEIGQHIPHPPDGGGGEGFLFAKKAVFVKLESPESSSRDLISYVHSLNAVQAVKIGSLNTKTTEEVNSLKQELLQFNNRVKRLSDTLKLGDLKEQSPDTFQIVDEYKHSKAFIENFLRDNEKRINKISEEYEEIRRNRDQIKLSLPFEEGLKERGIDAVLLQSGFQTVTYLGTIPKAHFKAVRFFLNEVTDNNLIFWDSESSDSSSTDRNILVLSLKEYETAILRVLGEYSFQAIESDLSLVERKVSLSETLENLEQELASKEEELQELSGEVKNKLIACDELISAELQRLTTLELCQISEGKIILWGWISKAKLKEIDRDQDFLPFKLEFTENPDVPLVNPAITKRGKVFGAVRGIVGGIGHPTTKEVDPYTIVRFTFPLLFGIMFADVGHGLILALIAGFLLYKKKKNKIIPDESMTGYLYAGAELLLFCALSATVFGFFFGSILGDEHLIPEFMHSIGVDWIPLINPLHETKLFLVVALILGFLMIQLGVWLKIYQNIRYGHGFASWAAPLTLSIIYFGIFGLLYNIIADGVVSHTFHFALPMIPTWVIYLIGLVPVLFVFEYMHAKSDGIMDAVDHIIALISNTLSFSRIMALLLVHAILSGLPFTLTGVDLLAGMSTFSPGSVAALDVAHIDLSHFAGGIIHGHYVSALMISWVWWVVGILLAVCLIVPLEGLLSFLNTLRLHWVEWFSKFYTGEGKEFLPLQENLKLIRYVPQKGS